MKISVKIYNPNESINEITKNNKVGIFAAETWGRYFSPYVPMQEGNLDQTRQTKPFKVIYTQPYAHRMHEGSGFNFSKEKHVNACAYWERPAFAASKNKVAKEIQKYISSI